MRRLARLITLACLLPLTGCLAGLSVRTPSLPHVVVHEGRYFVTGLGMRHGLRQGDSLWIQGERRLPGTALRGKVALGVAVVADVVGTDGETASQALPLWVLCEEPGASLRGGLAHKPTDVEQPANGRCLLPVLSVDAGQVRLGRGASSGVQVGDRYSVRTGGRLLDGESLGTLRVVEVGAQTSRAERLDGSVAVGQVALLTPGGPAGTTKPKLRVAVARFDALAGDESAARQASRQWAHSLAEAAWPGVEVSAVTEATVSRHAGQQAAEAQARAIGRRQQADLVLWGELLSAPPPAMVRTWLTVVEPQRLQPSHGSRLALRALDELDPESPWQSEAVRLPLGIAAALLGQASAAQQRYGEAAWALSRAVTLPELPIPERLRCRLLLAVSLRIIGQRAQARQQARQAQDLAQTAHLPLWTLRARAELLRLDLLEGLNVDLALAKLGTDAAAVGLWPVALLARYEQARQAGRVHPETARTLLLDLVPTLQQRGDRAGQAAVQHELGQLALGAHQLADARLHLTESLRLSESALDGPGEAAARLALAQLEARQGNLGLAQAHLTRSNALAQQSGDVAGQAMAVLQVAGLAAQHGDLPLARQLLDSLLVDNARRLDGEPALHAAVLHELGHTAWHLGDPAQSRSAYTDSLRRSQAQHDEAGTAAAWLALGRLARMQGRLDEATQQLRQAGQRAEALGDESLLAAVLHHQGRLRIAQGSPQDGRRWLLRSLTLAERAQDLRTQAATRVQLGILALREGQPVEASATLTKAAAQALAAGDFATRLEARRELLRLLAQRGSVTEALQGLHSGLAEAKRSVYQHALWLHTLADVTAQSGAQTAALPLLSEARALYAQLGMPEAEELARRVRLLDGAKAR